MQDKILIAVRLLFIVVLSSLALGCAIKNTNIEKQELERQKATDSYLERAEAFNEGIKKDEKPLAPRRELVSFDYGPESFNNNSFLEYLVASNAQLSSDIVLQLNQQEAKFKSEAEQHESLQELFTEITGLKKKISFYKALSQKKSMLYASTPVPLALQRLVEQLGYNINVNKKNRNKVAGNFEGTYFDLMKEIAKSGELTMSVTPDYMTLNFTATLPDDAASIDEKFLNAVDVIEIDADNLVDMILDASQQDSGEQAKSPLSNQSFQSKYVKNIVSQLLAKNVALGQAYSLSKLSSDYRQALIARHNQLAKNKTFTVANFDAEIENGKEKVIEKFSVYFDTPLAMKEKLAKYSFFTVNCPTTLATTTDTTVATTAATTTDTTAATTAVSTAATTAAAAITPTIVPETDTDSGCVSFTDDDDGVVAAGSITDVRLVEKFLVAQDTPVKQALIEAYILSVSSDWKLQLETALNDPGITPATIAGGTYDGMYSFATGLIDMAQAVSGGGLTASVGSKHIRALVNFIETNQIGKKISNPVILVKNGEQGIISQTITYKNTEATTVTNASTTTTTSGDINDYTAPITLTVTPEINAHNDEIDLTFNYTETVFDSASATAGETSNDITTKLKLQPGQVVMMAGLYQQTSERDRDGIPGTSWLGDVFYPLTLLLGGGQKNDTETGSELLVFINPTVITPQNAGYTLQRIQGIDRTAGEAQQNE